MPKYPKLAKAARERVSKKISRLVRSGEAKGKQAVAIAHSMERAGRVTEEGAYKRVKKARKKALG